MYYKINSLYLNERGLSKKSCMLNEHHPSLTTCAHLSFWSILIPFSVSLPLFIGVLAAFLGSGDLYL